MTVMIVAHRLSTIRSADIIFVLEKGKVVEKGCHEDLLEIQNGCYANLINRQMNVSLENNSSSASALVTNPAQS